MVFIKDNWKEITKFVNDIIDKFDYISNIKEILILLLILLVFLFQLNKAKNKFNTASIKIIESFKQNGKYIENIFIELDDNKEMLRYFINGKKWRKRIVRDINAIYNNYTGEILKKICSYSNTKFRFSYREKLNILLESILMQIELFNRINEDEFKYSPEFNEKIWFIRVNIYSYLKRVERIKVSIECASSKLMLLIGSAGNGKTNLSCNIVDLIIKSGDLCCFINSRDVSGTIEDHIKGIINLPKIINGFEDVYFTLLNLICKITKKNIFIVIDAINENDNPIFVRTLNSYLQRLLKYKNIKILMTCRSEYFEQRYDKIFKDNLGIEPLLLYMKESSYTTEALERVFQVYKEHFNFTGIISENSYSKLSKSLLFMRLFFEVNQNRNLNFKSLNKYEVYKSYIERLGKENPSINFELLINKISEYMIRKFEFIDVPINELNIQGIEISKLMNAVDENLLFIRKLVKHEGTIAEKYEEVVYFTLDELRDYCLSKFMIQDALDKSDEEYKLLFSVIEKLRCNYESPLEGILRYAYEYFKQMNNIEFGYSILELCNVDLYYLNKDRYHFYELRSNDFRDFGLSVIFENGEIIYEYEMDYIIGKLEGNFYDNVSIFTNLFNNSINGLKPDLSIILGLFRNAENSLMFESVLKLIGFNRINSEEDKRVLHIQMHNILDTKERFESLPDDVIEMILVMWVVDLKRDSIYDYINDVIKDEDMIFSIMKKYKFEGFVNAVRKKLLLV